LSLLGTSKIDLRREQEDRGREIPYNLAKGKVKEKNDLDAVD